jgi:hypothetical protein
VYFVAICPEGIGVAFILLLFVWQLPHCLGVPLKTPFTWQLSQRVFVCAPVSEKPVLLWSKWAVVRENFAACAGIANNTAMLISMNTFAMFLKCLFILIPLYLLIRLN